MITRLPPPRCIACGARLQYSLRCLACSGADNYGMEKYPEIRPGDVLTVTRQYHDLHQDEATRFVQAGGHVRVIDGRHSDVITLFWKTAVPPEGTDWLDDAPFRRGMHMRLSQRARERPNSIRQLKQYRDREDASA